MIPFGRPRNGEYDDLRSARSRAELTRVKQGYVQIALSLITIALIILTRT